MSREIDVYAHWTWDCQICGALNYVFDKDIKIVHCCRCGGKYKIRGFIGEVIKNGR